jgi:hypothetical protein
MTPLLVEPAFPPVSPAEPALPLVPPPSPACPPAPASLAELSLREEASPRLSLDAEASRCSPPFPSPVSPSRECAVFPHAQTRTPTATQDAYLEDIRRNCRTVECLAAGDKSDTGLSGEVVHAFPLTTIGILQATVWSHSSLAVCARTDRLAVSAVPYDEAGSLRQASWGV